MREGGEAAEDGIEEGAVFIEQEFEITRAGVMIDQLQETTRRFEQVFGEGIQDRKSTRLNSSH